MRMKYVFKISLLALLMAINHNLHAQKMMQTLGDAQKLKDNALYFRDKPLKVLLNEIGPEIKMVFVEDEYVGSESLCFITFKFVDFEDYKKITAKGKHPLSVTAMIKDNYKWWNHDSRPFKWDKPFAERMKWTREDVEKYGNLTIAYIRVSGEACTEVEGEN